MPKVLVTGGTGFIGANLVRRLVREDHEVHLLVRGAHQRWRIDELERAITAHTVSLSDLEALQTLVRVVQPIWIFHLAVHGAYSWQTDWQDMIETNLRGTANLLAACTNTEFEAFVNAGSSSEYGLKDHAPDEEEFAEPNSYYAATKLSATQFCKFWAQSHKQPVCTLRLYSAYGPYESPERLIPNLIVRGFDGKLPPLVHPAIARDYVYVEDVCDAFLAAAGAAKDHAGAVWNVGSETQTSIGEVVALTRSMLGVMDEPGFGSMANRGWDTNVWLSNCKRIHRDLGWTPRHSLEAGLSQLIGWFRKNDDLLKFYRRHLSVSTKESS